MRYHGGEVPSGDNERSDRRTARKRGRYREANSKMGHRPAKCLQLKGIAIEKHAIERAVLAVNRKTWTPAKAVNFTLISINRDVHVINR